jgi:hypothetical protein
MLGVFVNSAMMLKKRLNFFSFQWEKVDQVRNVDFIENVYNNIYDIIVS